ncbi:prolipoprotein diacylglyceryl transferase [Candidatus Peregrinibacteria bacterium]|nr:prolipoprotein diacylglyceryl transferase [Candidatus Peregrinibacteria bacterium]
MIDPVAFKIGPLSVRWYGISYGVGLLIGIWILSQLNKVRKVFKDTNQLFDFAFWVFLLGVILGGRLGYVLFYNLPYYLSHPTKIPAVWDGGMSFHGGLIASLIVGYVFCKKQKIRFLDVADLSTLPGALALTFTRLANFINHELAGRPIENPTWNWMGVDFGDGILRYPSQLFQSASALILFLVLLLIFIHKPKRGVLLFSYLMLYGLFRTVTEFWRAPDPQIGFIWQIFTLGQLFSFAMFLAGCIGLIALKRRP